MRNTKKGFTLVELLVVIAILAILATVSVVGYTSFIKRANVSNDQAMIGMINNNLQAAYVTGNPATAGDAITTLAGLGFYGDKFDAYTDGYHYAYNLTNNKFYLLDDEDNVVYPEECDKSQLWGLYDNNKYDLIDGVTKYVALSSVDIAEQFNSTGNGFQGGETIDLAGKVITVSPSKTNITIVNGYVEENLANSFILGDNITKITKTSIGNTIESGAKNAYFASEKQVKAEFVESDVVYENCVFDMDKMFVIIGDKNVTFKNCTFISVSDGNKHYALSIGDSDPEFKFSGKVTVENCTFESSRGININPGDDEAPEITIKNSTFSTLHAEKGAIQIAHINDNAVVTISGNTFVSCPAAIIVHANCALSSVSNVTFSNNTLGNNVNNVIADGTNTSQIIKELAAKFN